MTNARKRDLIERKIVAVDWRSWHDPLRGRITDPVLVLDNGTTISFLVLETDTSYGIRILSTRAPRSAKKPK